MKSRFSALFTTLILAGLATSAPAYAQQAFRTDIGMTPVAYVGTTSVPVPSVFADIYSQGFQDRTTIANQIQNTPLTLELPAASDQFNLALVTVTIPQLQIQAHCGSGPCGVFGHIGLYSGKFNKFGVNDFATGPIQGPEQGYSFTLTGLLPLKSTQEHVGVEWQGLPQGQGVSGVGLIAVGASALSATLFECIASLQNCVNN